MMETEQMSRGKAGTGGGNGESPQPSGPSSVLSSFSLQGLNSSGTVTPLKIFSLKKYTCTCMCALLPTIPGALPVPPRNSSLTMDLKLQPSHGTAFQGSRAEAEKRKKLSKLGGGRGM